MRECGSRSSGGGGTAGGGSFGRRGVGATKPHSSSLSEIASLEGSSEYELSLEWDPSEDADCRAPTQGSGVYSQRVELRIS